MRSRAKPIALSRELWRLGAILPTLWSGWESLCFTGAHYDLPAIDYAYANSGKQ